MTWRAFVRRVRRFTVLVIIALISSFLSLTLELGEFHGDAMGSLSACILMLAVAATLGQRVYTLRTINGLLADVDLDDGAQADRGGLLIPYAEHDQASEVLPEVVYQGER
jgi:hypothetical protein